MGDKSKEFLPGYTLLMPLAEGVRNHVYLGETAKNNQCVIKQLKKRSDPDEYDEEKRLFKREVELLSLNDIEHENIVPFMDSFVYEDKHFLIQEYVEGRNLHEVVAQYGSLSEDDALKIGIQVVEVLEYLHDKSLVYGGVQPSNLMLTREGLVVFTDFRMSHVFLSGQLASKQAITPGYSAPEQYFARPHPRSDLYSLGRTLFYLLTGITPKQSSEPVDPNKNAAKITGIFNSLILNLTAYTPDGRPPNAKFVYDRFMEIYSHTI